jgi:meso-butanediol dehydrogenase / (S,S)-butanediol dehydrogenase / diacetyl reductase
MGRLDGKVAVITGAASGIGKATVLSFLADGATVVAADMSAEGLAGLAAELPDASLRTAQLDVGSAEGVEAFFGTVAATEGRLDILVNSAGIGGRGTVESTTEELWDRVIRVNLTSIFLMCKHAVPMMKEIGGGRIINMGSGAGVVGVKEQAAYCASKGGVVLLTKQMALDYAPFGIRVNSVCPTTVLTPMVQNRLNTMPDPEQARRDLEAQLGPLLDAEEIADTIHFLATQGLKNAPVPYIQ